MNKKFAKLKLFILTFTFLCLTAIFVPQSVYAGGCAGQSNCGCNGTVDGDGRRPNGICSKTCWYVTETGTFPIYDSDGNLLVRTYKSSTFATGCKGHAWQYIGTDYPKTKQSYETCEEYGYKVPTYTCPLCNKSLFDVYGIIDSNNKAKAVNPTNHGSNRQTTKYASGVAVRSAGGHSLSAIDIDTDGRIGVPVIQGNFDYNRLHFPTCNNVNKRTGGVCGVTYDNRDGRNDYRIGGSSKNGEDPKYHQGAKDNNWKDYNGDNHEPMCTVCGVNYVADAWTPAQRNSATGEKMLENHNYNSWKYLNPSSHIHKCKVKDCNHVQIQAHTSPQSAPVLIPFSASNTYSVADRAYAPNYGKHYYRVTNTCTVCKAVETSTEEKVEESHTWGTWIQDITTHKTSCVVCGYPLYERHIWGAWSTTQSDGYKYRYCTVCNYPDKMPVTFSVDFDKNTNAHVSNETMSSQVFDSSDDRDENKYPTTLKTQEFNPYYLVSYDTSNVEAGHTTTGDTMNQGRAYLTFKNWTLKKKSSGIRVYDEILYYGKSGISTDKEDRPIPYSFEEDTDINTILNNNVFSMLTRGGEVIKQTLFRNYVVTTGDSISRVVVKQKENDNELYRPSSSGNDNIIYFNGQKVDAEGVRFNRSSAYTVKIINGYTDNSFDEYSFEGGDTLYYYQAGTYNISGRSGNLKSFLETKTVKSVNQSHPHTINSVTGISYYNVNVPSIIIVTDSTYNPNIITENGKLADVTIAENQRIYKNTDVCIYVPNSRVLKANWENGKVTLVSAYCKGYTFTGWYYDEARTQFAGKAGDTISIDRDTILYAKYKPNHYKVQYIDNNGENKKVVETKTAYWDSYFNLRKAPTKDGYVFKGWMLYEEDKNEANYSSDTNPMTTKCTKFFGSEEKVKNLTDYVGRADEDGTTITLVAIWEHSHPNYTYATETYIDENSNAYKYTYTNPYDNTSKNVSAVYFTDKPSYQKSTGFGYYLKTNANSSARNTYTIINKWTLPSNSWYKINRYYLVVNGDNTANQNKEFNVKSDVPVNSSGVMEDKNTGNHTLTVNGQDCMTVKPCMEYSCT